MTQVEIQDLIDEGIISQRNIGMVKVKLIEKRELAYISSGWHWLVSTKFSVYFGKDKIYWRYVYLPKGDRREKFTFEEVLDEVPDKIKDKLLFHLDIFTRGNNEVV